MGIQLTLVPGRYVIQEFLTMDWLMMCPVDLWIAHRHDGYFGGVSQVETLEVISPSRSKREADFTWGKGVVGLSGCIISGDVKNWFKFFFLYF